MSDILFDGDGLQESVKEKELKASNTGVREIHEINWHYGRPCPCTISEINVPGIVSNQRLNNPRHKLNLLYTVMSMICTSSKLSLLVPCDKIAQAVNKPEFEQSHNSQYTKVFKATLRISDAEFDYGVDTNVDQIECIPEDYSSNSFLHKGLACYSNRERTKHLSLDTVKLLNILFVKGNMDKVSRVTTNMYRIANIEYNAYSNWHEQDLVFE